MNNTQFEAYLNLTIEYANLLNSYNTLEQNLALTINTAWILQCGFLVFRNDFNLICFLNFIIFPFFDFMS